MSRPYRYSTIVFFCLVLLCLSGLSGRAGQDGASGVHALAISGQPKYPAGFAHFDYADPAASKGGQVRLAAIGTFDSFNPFISKGDSPSGLGLIYDTLTVQSQDEPFTAYGLLARSMEMPPDRSWIIFHMDPEARFHDGHPVTAHDVVFTFNLLMAKGAPHYKHYYAGVEKAEALDERRARFSFKPGVNPELPLILGQLNILPEHWWKERDFSKPSLEPPLGSGPYRVASFKAGRTVAYERVKTYWAKDRPVNRGRFNFDTVSMDYYRDNTVALEAFKSGEYDYRQEYVSKDWATAYDGPALAKGYITKETIPNSVPQGMQGFVMNTRRPVFADREVRRALAYAFDFNWSNEHLFYGQYKRTRSYYSNSELGSSGLPEGRELEILEKFRGRVPDEVFTTQYDPPATDGSGNLRGNLRQALRILRQAGWEVRDGVMTNKADGRRLEFEILYVSPAFERILGPFAGNLAKLGVKASLRLVDSSQYINRLTDFDFDMTVFVWGQSMSPGNEQRDFWHSASAGIPGSRNMAGIKDPVVDELVEMVISAPDRAELTARVRALDRVLLWGHYVIPNWHMGAWRVAHWDIFAKPKIQPPYALDVNSWWIDPTGRDRVDAWLGREGR